MEEAQKTILHHACGIVRDAFSPSAGGLGEAMTNAARQELAEAGVDCLLKQVEKVKTAGLLPASGQASE